MLVKRFRGLILELFVACQRAEAFVRWLDHWTLVGCCHLATGELMLTHLNGRLVEIGFITWAKRVAEERLHVKS
jgi:hypothetical protein